MQCESCTSSPVPRALSAQQAPPRPRGRRRHYRGPRQPAPARLGADPARQRRDARPRAARPRRARRAPRAAPEGGRVPPAVPWHAAPPIERGVTLHGCAGRLRCAEVDGHGAGAVLVAQGVDALAGVVGPKPRARGSAAYGTRGASRSAADSSAPHRWLSNPVIHRTRRTFPVPGVTAKSRPALLARWQPSTSSPMPAESR
jgi:hypothetical protein